MVKPALCGRCVGEAWVRRVAVNQALGLAQRHREVLVLHYVAELPLDEVARQLRLPLGTVKSRLSRAQSPGRAGRRRAQGVAKA
jgi:DNA-directed RNA polymerase specialized sigma24 family protein